MAKYKINKEFFPFSRLVLQKNIAKKRLSQRIIEAAFFIFCFFDRANK